MGQRKIKIRQVAQNVFEICVSEELYQKLKEAADLAGLSSVDAFVSASLLPTRLSGR